MAFSPPVVWLKKASKRAGVTGSPGTPSGYALVRFLSDDESL